MPNIKVHSLISYPSYEECGASFRQVDFDCMKLVKCYKGNVINGFLTLSVNKVNRKYYQKDSEDLINLVNNSIARMIENISKYAVTLVPVPNSNATIANKEPFRTQLLALQISQILANGSQVQPCLRWRTPAGSAHKDGTSRDPQILEANLELESLPTNPVILFDDVLTSGGHIRACARKLRNAGISVDHAFTAARTVWQPADTMISVEDRDYSLDDPVITWDQF
ncbi:hypothetical protein AA23498_1207 [Acetobacter nitrogenifigens DSM 23921 = NBRC 105050]|uniref:Phosphoribosyltransferase domain-containing protein n=1 Tax=Acetobacter nitrogenifigens DSM 23921 = NBRC 105050 TaxID=1120919 RepID=A0A511XD20_9PROT|nr:hypothetical protein [Acetobacter nitrogenifigens]GBQ91526.1 hypothetical protein AA23498_1207 [Acetobacter nitrogenifigens DSM 23921 = NBRC 105050]GEN60842.1 hypothetical protein ANI02nite_27260 [Acetobacter nitrogenifigens DSM 23921 = NBRC 105050]